MFILLSLIDTVISGNTADQGSEVTNFAPGSINTENFNLFGRGWQNVVAVTRVVCD